MLHARKDYQRIQDPAKEIPENEPVFLLRAQDKIAPSIVNFWANLAEEQGASPEIVKAAREHAAKMRAWQKQHKVKVPDL